MERASGISKYILLKWIIWVSFIPCPLTQSKLKRFADQLYKINKLEYNDIIEGFYL